MVQPRLGRVVVLEDKRGLKSAGVQGDTVDTNREEIRSCKEDLITNCRLVSQLSSHVIKHRAMIGASRSTDQESSLGGHWVVGEKRETTNLGRELVMVFSLERDRGRKIGRSGKMSIMTDKGWRGGGGGGGRTHSFNQAMKLPAMLQEENRTLIKVKKQHISLLSRAQGITSDTEERVIARQHWSARQETDSPLHLVAN